MGMIARLFGSPATPQMPPPPPPPPQLPVGDAAAAAQRRSAAAMTGIDSTIATGPQGLTAPAQTTGKALTGQ